MRDEEFKQRLTEVAEWHIPLDIDLQQGVANKLKKLAKLQAEGEPIGNPTYPPKLDRIKHPDMACEDCGKIVQGRKKEIQIYKNKTICGRKEKCVNCGLHKDPYTGQFCLTGTEASIKWNSYAKGAGRRYKTKQTLAQPISTKVVSENEHERITIYHQKINE